MGYDLHITRRADWSGTGDDITAEEWLAYVRRDPELALSGTNGPHFAIWKRAGVNEESWFDWSDGQIFAKNPPPALVDKMIAIARAFGAAVQGDDGEIYEGAARQAPPRAPSAWQRIAALFRRTPRNRGNPRIRGNPRTLDIDHAAFPFKVGDRIRDTWRQRGVIVAIDPAATYGMGRVRVRYDDGREVAYSMTAHPFQKEPPSA